jgi:hypothetical protein
MIIRLSLASALFLSMGFISTANADLVAFYSGNGNASDSVSGQNGTLVNGAGFGPGLFGQAFLFNGVNQYVSVPNDSNWSFGSNPFTINLFVNFNSITPGSSNQIPNVLVSDDLGPGNIDKWAFFYDGGGHLGFDLNSPSLPFFTVSAPTSFLPTTHTWHDFAITRSGSTYTFYADGVSLGTAASAVAVPQALAPLRIGYAEGIDYLNGSIENVGIYNEALTASQIAAISSVPEPSSLIVVCLACAMGAAAAGWRRLSPMFRRQEDDESRGTAL